MELNNIKYKELNSSNKSSFLDCFNITSSNNIDYQLKFFESSQNIPILKKNEINLSHVNDGNYSQLQNIFSLPLNEQKIVDGVKPYKNPKLKLKKFHKLKNIREDNDHADKFSSKYKVVYCFNTDISRKKEKKNLRNLKHDIISRVHNTDSMLKKIKSKYLKFLYNSVSEKSGLIIKKFDQVKEVRNLQIKHNRDEFINLTVLEFLYNSCIFNFKDLSSLLGNGNEELNLLLKKKIKFHFNFEFLNSDFFKKWMIDPISMRKKLDRKGVYFNKNCMKFPKHSKNIFANQSNYSDYIKMLFHTAHNFIFYFQNNPLKYGKKSNSEFMF